MTDRPDANPKAPSVTVTRREANEYAQRRANEKGMSFTVYYIAEGDFAGRHTYEPAAAKVPPTWRALKTFDPELLKLEVGEVELEDEGAAAPPLVAEPLKLALEDAEPEAPSLCEFCRRGVGLDALGLFHPIGGALDLRPCSAAVNVEIEGENVGEFYAKAVRYARQFANVEREPFVVYAQKKRYLVRRKSFDLNPAEAQRAQVVEPDTEETLPVPAPDDAKPFVVHATRASFFEGDPAPMICGKEFPPARVFAAAPKGAGVEHCPDCQRTASTEFAPDARFTFAVENYPDPTRHVLLTVFTGEGLLRECHAFCTCGEWNYKAHGEENGFDEEFLKECQAVHAEHAAAAPTVATKKEQIISLFESGTRDIAEIVRRVKARPSYVAQVLQQAGHLEGYFDLYQTTGREQNVYTRYFRNVLHFRNVEAARESVARIDRLYNYFERLGDRAGQHQATILALTGRNRARWSGKLEESQVFKDWLDAH